LDAAGRNVITSYAVHRPDGNWSLMLINHDLNAAHQIHLVIDDANHVQRSFAGPVTFVQYCNTPSESKNTTMTPSPDGMYTLPIGSITVIRGKVQ
jgi:endoglucanase Acf2